MPNIIPYLPPLWLIYFLIANLFYCDPVASYQKPHVERNSGMGIYFVH